MNIPWITHKKIDPCLVSRFLDTSMASNQMTNYGPAVEALEDYLREELLVNDSNAVIATVNATAAMHAIISAMHIHHGVGTVTTPAYTFPSNIEGPLRGAVVCDVGDNLIINESSSTGCLVVTNLFGMLQQSPIKYITDNPDTIVIFDNAATPFSFFLGRNIVNYGDGCIVSLHHTKQLGFGEGGVAIVGKKYEETVRSLINFGIPTGHQEFGFNGKMSCVSAAYIQAYLTQNLKSIKEHHQALNVRYRGVFEGYETLSDVGKNSVPFCFPIFVDNASEVIQKLKDRGIDARQYYRPVYDLPNATRQFNRIVCLPCNLSVKLSDVETMREIIR